MAERLMAAILNVKMESLENNERNSKFLRKRTATYSSQHLDGETYKEDCSGKLTSDSRRQTSSSSEGKRRSVPDSILGAQPPKLKPNLDTVHDKKEIHRALNTSITPKELHRESVPSARLKRSLDIVHAKKAIYRALNINQTALNRETIKSAPKSIQLPEEPKPTVHKSTNIGKPSENRETIKKSDGNCSRLNLEYFLRKRMVIYSSQQLDSETYKDDDCSGKHTESEDSGRQTSLSSSSWKRLQLEQLKEEVKELVLDRPEGVRCMELMELYREQYDRELNLLRFGYKSIVSFACSLGPRVIVSYPTKSGDCLLHDARRIPDPPAREHVRCLTASRLQPVAAPVDPHDSLPGIDFTSECYLYPRFHALETGATPNYAEIHAFLRDGTALDYVDDYRQHVPVEAYRPPPTPASDPTPSPSPTPPPTLELVNRVPLFPSRPLSSQDSGSECAASDTATEEPCSSSSPPPPPTPPPRVPIRPPSPAAAPRPPPAPAAPPRPSPPQMMMPNFMAQPYPSMQSLYYQMYPPYVPPSLQLYQMSPWPAMQDPAWPQMQYTPLSPPSFNVNPDQHHNPPTPVPHPPYQSPTKPVEALASETKTPPRPRSPPTPYNDASGGRGAVAGGSRGEETRRDSTAHGDVKLTASECEIFSLLSRVDADAAHWYMVDAIGRRMTTSCTSATSTVASTLNPHAAELQQVAATETEACAGDSLQPSFKLFTVAATPARLRLICTLHLS